MIDITSWNKFLSPEVSNLSTAYATSPFISVEEEEHEAGHASHTVRNHTKDIVCGVGGVAWQLTMVGLE